MLFFTKTNNRRHGQVVRHRSAKPLFLGSNPSGASKTKSTARAVLFCFGNEAHLRCMKNEAGLCPMKRAFGSRRSSCALRFMATKLPLHTSVASASYRRKPMLHFEWQRFIDKIMDLCYTCTKGQHGAKGRQNNDNGIFAFCYICVTYSFLGGIWQQISKI